MIQRQRIGQATFAVVAGDVVDFTTLHNLGAVPLQQMNVPAALLVGAGPGDYLPYRISATIGRGRDRVLTGPDGRTLQGASYSHDVRYLLSGVPASMAFSSPISMVITPDFVLPPPILAGPGNLTVTLTGAVEAEHVHSPGQAIRLELFAQASGRDPLLYADEIQVGHDPGIWDGLLIPYSATVQLSIDGNGFVAGPRGSSGQRHPRIYQVLVTPGSDPDISSDTTEVP
jgi:hypothetical protein